MSSEKMAILKMLDEGKITADNAAKLLAALGDENAGGAAPGGAPHGAADAPGAGRDYGSQARNAAGTGAGASWTADLGKKIEVIAKDLEPKLQKLVGTVAEKSVEFADKASKGIQSARETARADAARRAATPRPAPAPTPTAPPPSATAAPGGVTELKVTPDMPNELILKSPRGGVSIKGYNGDKATLKISSGGRVIDKGIEFLQLGCVYQLNYDTSITNINIEAFVPFGMFKSIRVETSYGSVALDNLECQMIDVNTSNCSISVKNIKCDNVKLDNLNGEVLLSNASGQKIRVENANGAISVTNADFAEAKIETTAEPIQLVCQGFYKYDEYRWVFRTSNARMKASLPVALDTGYDIKAYTSLSDLSNGLSGITYTRNERNSIEGKTENFDRCSKKVYLEMDTSNAPLQIN